jgi:hypothetical protein
MSGECFKNYIFGVSLFQIYTKQIAQRIRGGAIVSDDNIGF